MKLEFKVCGSLCAMDTFVINGVHADKDDFGEGHDAAPEDSEGCGSCGNRVFERCDPSQDVLDKYSITEDEYDEICQKLEDSLSFGFCGMCI